MVECLRGACAREVMVVRVKEEVLEYLKVVMARNQKSSVGRLYRTTARMDWIV